MYSSSALFFFRFGESSLPQQVAMSVGAAVFATQTEETMGKPPFKTIYALGRALQCYQETPSDALWQEVEARQTGTPGEMVSNGSLVLSGGLSVIDSRATLAKCQ